MRLIFYDYLNRPFCPSALWRSSWLCCVACKIVPEIYLTDKRIVDDVEDKLFSKYITILVMFYHCFYLSVALNSHTLRTRWHDRTISQRSARICDDEDTSPIPIWSFTLLLYFCVLMYCIHLFLHRILTSSLYSVCLSCLLNEYVM